MSHTFSTAWDLESDKQARAKAEALLVGKVVQGVDWGNRDVTLRFTDGSALELKADGWEVEGIEGEITP